MVKHLKNFLLQNQESFGAESLYIASTLMVYQVCSNDDCRLTSDLFMARSNLCLFTFIWGLIVLGFNDTSTLVGHFVSSPREREKRDRRESRGDEREGQGRKRNRNKSEETEEIKTFPLYPYPIQG